MRLAALAGLLVVACATPAAAVPAYDVAFVSAFADACVPQRMSYPGTRQTALAGGWSEVTRKAHPELDAMLGISEAAAAGPDVEASFEYALFSKPIAGQDHFLVVGRTSAIIGEPSDPLNPWVYIGCYLYNFDASGPIDPGPVSALTGNPIANSHIDETLVGYVWGPPCPMPRTGDTYLTYVPEGSLYAVQTGFSGLVLKFETSEPGPDETVPASYC